jgi:fatty acid desaturase
MQSLAYDSLGKVRRSLDDDLFRVRPTLYRLDFGVSMAVSWVAFCLSLPRFTPAPPLRVVCLLVAALGFYRSLLFVHELVHQRNARLKGFRVVWNVLCGSMFFLPDFTYAIHSFHHLTATFSTSEDPEYVPIAWQKPVELLAPFLIFPFAPLALMLRFLLAAPLSWIIGGAFRETLLRHASSLKMNPKFEWKVVSAEDRRLAVIEEAGCLLWWTLFITLAFVSGEPRIILHWYVLAWCILTLNHIRAMVAHGYINAGGKRVTHEEQLLDSVTIAGWSPMASLLAPVGLRYHSLHHLFPTLPYHSMGKAHQCLLEVLPPDHTYRKTLIPDMATAFRTFFTTLRTNRSN